MRSSKRGTTRVRATIASALVLLATLTLGSGMASGAPQVPFTVAPTSLSLAATVGGSDFDVVTVTTGRRSVVIENTATFASGAPFSDTQAGTCWQNYGALGFRVPANTACTIQVGFHPTAAGTFNDVMTVYACKKSHVDATTGRMVCDARGGSQTVALTGTAATAPSCTYAAGTSGCIVLTNVAITDNPSTATYILSGQLTFTPTCQNGVGSCSYAPPNIVYTGSGTFSVSGSQNTSGTWAVPASPNDGDTPYQFLDASNQLTTCPLARIRQITPFISLIASSGGANVGGFLFIRQDTVGTTSRVSGVFDTGTAPVLPPGTFRNPFDSLAGVTINC